MQNIHRTYLLLATVLLMQAPILIPKGQAASARYAYDTEEVLLTFRYRGVGNVFVTGLYDYSVDQMYLPVSELFSLLQIYYEASPGDFSLTGTYLRPDKPFRIYFNRNQVVLSGRTYDFEADDFRIGEMDYFASPKVLEEVFELFFTINMNLLTLSLETDLTLPVVERAERERTRQLVEAREVTREYLPLGYDRERRVLGIGFVDYNITGSFAQSNPSMSYNLTGGMEVLGGDLQGNLIGSWSEVDHRIRPSGLRWRYVVRENPWFSRFSAGQLSTTGLQPRSIRGASVSNEPVEPRRLYEAYIIDGTTEPDSEVELYLNNRLIDFLRADASGYYRFEFPLTYGTSRLTINIFTPTGEAKTIDRQLQIPFTFLPPGEVAYNIQGGLTETFLGDDEEEKRILHGDVAVGLSKRITAKAGSEYIQDFNNNKPFFYGGLSARVFSQYLLNLDVAPDAYIRATTSVMYPSGRSFNVQYTHYDGESLFNTRGTEQDINANVFIPFNLFNTQMGFRLAAEHYRFANNSITRYRTDLSLRIGRMNVRMNYRDALFYSEDEYTLTQGLIATSLTYTFMRSAGVPVFARGMFLRGNISYNTTENTLDQVDLQLTRSIRQMARINLSAGYDFRSERHYVRLGFIMDLQSVRSTTNVDVSSDRASVRQNFRGSLGFDHNPDRIVPGNRNQVGRAGVSVILFVDNNNSGTFDEGDEIIPHRAIRLDRSAQMHVGSDGVLRISQLQSYYRYNLEVMRNALPNPLLAPGKDRFSFVADPNRYKRIEIPFYRTGIIDGTVYFLRDDVKQPQGGLRIIIEGVDVDFDDTIRNFSDGSYYAMDMPPGNYTVTVDQTQLDFLSAHIPDGPIHFEIRALAGGDFIESLDIIIKPRPEVQKEELPEEKPDTETENGISVAEEPFIDEILQEVSKEKTEKAITTEASREHHYLVVHHFASIYIAEEARQEVAKATGEKFFIRYDEQTNRYMVYSSVYDEIEVPQALISLLAEKGYDTKLQASDPDGPEPMRFQIQLAAFADEEEAKEALRNAQNLTTIPLLVESDSFTGRFVLRSHTYQNIPEASEALKVIRSVEGYGTAFVVSRPRIFALPVISISDF